MSDIVICVITAICVFWLIGQCVGGFNFWCKWYNLVIVFIGFCAYVVMAFVVMVPVGIFLLIGLLF